tara:strand:+ start:3676 stop:3855 length:180 start_codon:yes stop_codon:yes gene_type:complete
MTLDLFAILVNAVSKAIEFSDDAQYVLSVIFIGVILGVGTWWALMILSASFFKKMSLKK